MVTYLFLTQSSEKMALFFSITPISAIRTGHDNIAQYVTIFMKNNFEDWYLPNVDEMITLVDTFNKKGIQIPRKHYWTSSQNDTENASAIYVDNASEIVRRETRKKTHHFPAIPVRNF